MKTVKNIEDEYLGFEQGPIRPPSEANSLLIRVTRNCPWNRCTFCPVYKGSRFSLRSVDHVIKDIDLLHRLIVMMKEAGEKTGYINREEISRKARNLNSNELQAFHAAFNWMAAGMESVFIQDANSLIIKPSDLIKILKHLKDRFPWIKRITSYARSHTIARIKDEDMRAIGDAGLNRIHIGLESGADAVLKMVKKGSTQEVHIKAGLKVKKAGIELSEYVMPGLGGKALSIVHAVETADALNIINPEFIRLRTLAIPNSVELFKEYESKRFEKCTDLMMAEEILLFLETLDGITSTIKSDHILNLFEEIEGRLPDEKEKMLAVLREFLSMPPERQMLYQVGRRLGFFSRLKDLENSQAASKAEETCRQLGITPENVDATIDELMKRFI
ncbi:MAG: radical SAM protein [Deltaproteobacteria bacterium]|nr:radical SAM protein [Deltaproteobacteria bacterium]